MTSRLSVHLLPELADPRQMAGNVQVVIDVLRASTTIAYAIAAGARHIVPCLEISEARELARKSVAEKVLLGGERQGKPITGFDLGNSPAEYQPDRVQGAALFFTTTNGTRAMMRCIGAGRVLIASFANLSAVVDQLSPQNDVDVICAGTDGQVTREDVMLAGAVACRLSGMHPSIKLNDSARVARDVWRSIGAGRLDPEVLARELTESHGGRNLVEIGMETDIQVAAHIDAVDEVPELKMGDWQIVRSPDTP